MKERPILFSAPMVRALLAGTKTQTRRAVAFPRTRDSFVLEDHGAGWWPFQSDDGESSSCNDGMEHPYNCPYGQAGDRLWVREAWARTRVYGTEMLVFREGDNRTDYGGPWKPGIHMFRRDSRITLEVTDVRVERLQDISEADALAEGIVQLRDGGYGLADTTHYHFTDPRNSYWSLWESINGAGSVEANPWVWAVSFRRIEGAKP